MWRDGTLYRVTLIPAATPQKVQRPIEFCIRALMLVLALVLLIKGTEFALGSGERTTFLRIDKTYWYAAVPVAGLLMTIYSIVGLVRLVLGLDRSLEPGSDQLS